MRSSLSTRETQPRTLLAGAITSSCCDSFMKARGIRIGVVGAGYWGPNLIRECADLGVLDSVCDIDEAALTAAQKSHPKVATTTEFDELLARPIDAVIVASPAQLHADMALRAIAA